MFGCPPTVVGPDFCRDLLGDGYEVIEEGLNGRTTDVDYEDRPGHNGRPYFGPCLLSHQPLDVVVVMLGSNDLKACFGRTPTDIAEALHGYIDDVAANVTEGGRVPAIVLVSPVRIDDTAEWFEEISAGDFDPEIVSRSQEPHRRDSSRRPGTGCVVRRRARRLPA